MVEVYPLIVSNNILNLANIDKISVTPMKLQKLLYFLYRDYLQKTKKPLFSERFEAWKYGPVISSVYAEFSHYKDKPIKEFYKDSEGHSYKLNEEKNRAFGEVLYSVWDKYKFYDGIALSKITHQKGTAWYKAWTKNAYYLDDKDIMDDKVSDFFESVEWVGYR